ncbi:MAG: hypothetical protein M1834_000445 [Cirrosporium novae-zelandiae]|nr:MAG: hypothetical protein M1834_000445 [Cirrosporium novae-zelandiae]
MTTWIGSIDTIKDVRLHASSGPTLPSSTKVTLQNLSLVDPTRIPLHLMIGPAWDVWTLRQDTKEYFEALCWGIGQLVKVHYIDEDEEDEEKRTSPRITELLFYAVKPTNLSNGSSGMPNSPPASSPPNTDSPDSPAASRNTTSPSSEMRVYCLPLSSDLIYKLAEGGFSQVPLKAREAQDHPAQFLPTPFQQNAQHLPKRQRVEDLFDEIAEQRRRARHSKGENVAHMMASMERHVSPFIGIKKESGEEGLLSRPASRASFQAHPCEESRKMTDAYRARQHSRTPSLGGGFGEFGRPPSRKDGVQATKRSSLHQVASVASFNGNSPVADEDCIEGQNKCALSRVVMAGMRLYGFQQQKHHADADTSYEEYKMMYHQTYRAAAFALRGQMAGPEGIELDMMRGVVDSVLGIFCNDGQGKSSKRER